MKRLRVIGLEYRPVHIGWNWQYGWHSTQGKIGTPIAVGNGAYDVKHVLGEADVEVDGSCSVDQLRIVWMQQPSWSMSWK